MTKTISVPADSLLEQIGDACLGFDAYHTDLDNPPSALDAKQDALALLEAIHHATRALGESKHERCVIDVDAREVLRRWEVEGMAAHDAKFPGGIPS